MKKQIIVLSCVAAVAIATFVGKKAYEPSLNESSNLLKQNVEALTQGNEEPYPEERKACIEKGGNWNMASVCVASGFESSNCTVAGEITIFGVTVKGSYEKGKMYSLPWARYECKDSKGNCCTKQGLYSGSQKLA